VYKVQVGVSSKMYFKDPIDDQMRSFVLGVLQHNNYITGTVSFITIAMQMLESTSRAIL